MCPTPPPPPHHRHHHHTHRLVSPAWPAEFLPLPRLNAMEQGNFESMKAELRSSIQKGVDFMNT